MKRIATTVWTCLFLAAALFAAGAAWAAREGHTHSFDKKTPTKTTAATSQAIPAAVDSLKLLEAEVARDSSQFDLLFRLGVMYLDRDRFTNALKVLHRANKIDPRHVPTMVNLGAAYDASNVPEMAQAYYQQALEISPEDPVALCRMASSVYAQGNYAEAMDMLRDVIEADSTSYCAYFTLGVAFADAGIYRDAVRMWKKVVFLAPGTPEAASAMESIEVLERFIGR